MLADHVCQHAQETRGSGPQKASERQAPHSNVIVDMHIFTSGDGRPTGNFSTAGWDGRVLLWRVDMSTQSRHSSDKGVP